MCAAINLTLIPAPDCVNAIQATKLINMNKNGVVAAGHEETARVAQIILQEGGNAFDAIVAAHFAACVSEPVLASLGGGGYLLAHPKNDKNVVYDFFVQTPKSKTNIDSLDFYPISADFGKTQQEFHIGWGSVATPGSIKGLFAIHKDLCRIPMRELMQPAICMAKEGIKVNAFQAYIFNIVESILTATSAAKAIYSSKNDTNKIIAKDETHHQPDLAEVLDALSIEGDALFYRGEIAQRIAKANHDSGGHLTLEDLTKYQVNKLAPLTFHYRDTKIITNSPPSSGGILIAFALKLLENSNLEKPGFGSVKHLDTLAQVMGLTNKARVDAHFDETVHQLTESLLNPEFISLYKKQILNRPQVTRGTTHISVIDKQGNMASLTTSNGEGCGHIVSGTGTMLNNMLGEEDLTPGGFHNWPCDQRMTSMMAPTIAFTGQGQRIALGSGGSNRLRTAILQVLINLIDFKMPLEAAVNSPRIHIENDLLSVEDGFKHHEIKLLREHYKNNEIWDTQNLFFGGAHSVMEHKGVCFGAGDQRRGGVSIVV